MEITRRRAVATDVQITVPIRRFEQLVAYPFSWTELATMSHVATTVADREFWRVQILEDWEGECMRTQACVRGRKRSHELAIHPLQQLLPVNREEPGIGVRSTEQKDQESPRTEEQDLLLCPPLKEWEWIRKVHYTHRYMRWKKRWQMVMCIFWSDAPHVRYLCNLLTAFPKPHLRVSAAKVVLSSEECFRLILPFIVKMRYEHVDEYIRRQYRRLGPHD